MNLVWYNLALAQGHDCGALNENEKHLSDGADT